MQHMIEVSSRCKQLLESLRDSRFPADKNNPMDQLTLGEFIYTICCSMIYHNKGKKK
jgi:hypothetical protein